MRFSLLESIPDKEMYCRACNKKVKGKILALDSMEHPDYTEESLDTSFIVCSMECANSLHERMTGKPPQWKDARLR